MILLFRFKGYRGRANALARHLQHHISCGFGGLHAYDQLSVEEFHCRVCKDLDRSLVAIANATELTLARHLHNELMLRLRTEVAIFVNHSHRHERHILAIGLQIATQRELRRVARVVHIGITTLLCTRTTVGTEFDVVWRTCGLNRLLANLQAILVIYDNLHLARLVLNLIPTQAVAVEDVATLALCALALTLAIDK